MSSLVVVPQVVAAASKRVAKIGAAVRSANSAAATSTTAVLVAGGDEVSEAIAALFSDHAGQYQVISAEVSAFHARFVEAIGAAGASYEAAEAAAVDPLQGLAGEVLGAINAQSTRLSGRPLIGNGANGAAGT
ncbi:PE family protein, partial [Mycobacterium gordonae]|uniref:PE family protein n=1 Tax=Mycobacterium gordonae TaxID=1778 RepID=UPI00210C61B2